MKLKTYDISLVGMFAALMAIGANITSVAPFLQVAGVPLSMQPFFCILAGLLIGSRLGALSMIVYALIGIAGAPVFAGFSGGPGVIIGSTGGFILSYIVAAYVAGRIVERSQNPGLPSFYTASFAGIVLIYVIGTTYMYAALNFWMEVEMTYLGAWGIMSWFIVKDAAFTVLGAVIAPRIYKSVHRGARLGRRSAA
ncbi:BioY family transporter [Bacillus lacus]|uniref:Biotin transporter n=1 Tax=Metabacillus lacus TaxID=1983721 RepID=A0A7X2M0S6_9BACI|nr:biotin transporter BioY [Metabacillus lacus]MRX73189.1 BioY family transporter [Metabacillus lacus]